MYVMCMYIHICTHMKPARGPQTMFLVIDGCGIIVVPTMMKGQAKCAKAVCVSSLKVPGLRYLGLGTQANTQES